MDFTTVDARRQLAMKYATKYGIETTLVCALCEQESSWNPWSVRFEPGFLNRYVRPSDPTRPTTLDITKAMSFGLMQIMGETAIELGFTGKYLTELCDPNVGLEFGCKKLKKCFDVHGGVEPSLLAYNGGGDPNYPHLVLRYEAKYAV